MQKTQVWSLVVREGPIYPEASTPVRHSSWACASSRNWWWTGKPDVLQSMGSQRVRHDWVTELNWNEAFVHAKSLHSRLTLCGSLDCSLSGSSVHGLFQLRVLEWVATTSSRGSSQPRDWTCISYISFIRKSTLFGNILYIKVKFNEHDILIFMSLHCAEIRSAALFLSY